MNALNRNFRKYIILIVVLLVTLSLTACGNANQTENAVTPMDSICEEVNEFGIDGYASSLKENYDNAQKNGDIGNITIALGSETTQEFYTAPWWVDEWNQEFTSDIVVIAGNVGDCYYGSIKCFKCGFSHTLDNEIGETPSTMSVQCNCDGNDCIQGMRKLLTIAVIPLS